MILCSLPLLLKFIAGTNELRFENAKKKKKEKKIQLARVFIEG